MNLEDIAKEAGVSRATVSRVINNAPSVSKKTRDRVMEVVERLNFSPNPSARALVTRSTGIVGIVISSAGNIFFGDNSYFPMLLQGIAEAAHQYDHHMMLWLGQPDENRDQFAQRVLRNRVYDGLIIGSLTADDPLIKQLVDAVPYFVMVERPLYYEDQISSVTVDNIAAGELATEHLISLGYRRIAHISGQMTISDGQDRLTGFRRAMQAANLPDDLVRLSTFSHQGGYHSMKSLLDEHPDAVFAAGDTSATGAMQAIQEAGLRVPEDIAVMGFDDIDVATKSVPKLPTIRQPIQQKGAAAFRLLMDLMRGGQRAQRILLPTQLVIRQSCGYDIRQPQTIGGVTFSEDGNRNIETREQF